jgi:DNA-binding NtrC family response regulator
MKTVLILDSDPGYQFWLGQVLSKAGYRGVPARSVAEVNALIKDLDLKIDLLIIDPRLEGAAEFVQATRSFPAPPHIIAAIERYSDLEWELHDVDVVRFKPSVADDLETMAEKWLTTIRSLTVG